MHDAESRALRRAMVVLVGVSVVRWLWGQGGGVEAPASTSILPELSESVARAALEAEQRSRPLGPGERIDPNRASAAELDRLPGIGPSTADAVVRAREEGAVFRTADDLLAVRGIGPALAARMRPHLDFQAPPNVAARRSGVRARVVRTVDLNRAGVEELTTLRGVGPAIAARIVERRRQRPFRTVDDLLEVKGIGPATLERIRPHVGVGTRR